MKLKRKGKPNTIVYRSEEWELEKGISLHVFYQNDVITSQAIIKGKTNLFLSEDGNTVREYFKTHTYTENEYTWPFKVVENPLQHIQQVGYDRTNLFINQYGSHTVTDVDGNYLDIVIPLDYIEGFRQLVDNDSNYWGYVWKWDELRKHLKSHPNVLKFEEHPIPYYNSDFGGQMAFKLSILFESKWRIKGEAAWNDRGVILSKSDPLGVKQFQIKLKKRK